MNKVINLKVADGPLSEIIHYVQGATEIPLEFHIKDYEIPSGSTARIYLKRPDNTESYNDCTISGNVITYKPTAQFFSVAGICTGQLQIMIGDDFLVTFPLVFDVAENIIDDSAIESSNEYGALESLLQEAQENIPAAGEAAEAANQAAQSANNAANAANQAAQSANNAANAANQAAGTASQAATAATNAAGSANQAAGSANQAATAATTAAGSANTAASAANQAKQDADTAAGAANSAASSATTAAGQANTAAGNANNAASAANSAKEAANTAAGAANSAASAANQAAQAANDAAGAVNDVIDKIPDIGNYPFYPYYGSGTDNTVTPGMGMLAEVAGGRATFTNDEATQIGYLRISLPEEPTKTQQAMIAFDVLIASYSNNATGIYSIGGELFRRGTTAQDGWARQSAVFIGKHDTGIADLPVVFGMDPTTYRRYVQIGNEDTDWGYGCAVIKNIRSYWNMYRAENWKEGWSIEITTEPIPGTTISDDPTIIQPITAGGTGATSVAGALLALGIASKIKEAGTYSTWDYITLDNGFKVMYGVRLCTFPDSTNLGDYFRSIESLDLSEALSDIYGGALAYQNGDLIPHFNRNGSNHASAEIIISADRQFSGFMADVPMVIFGRDKT